MILRGGLRAAILLALLHGAVAAQGQDAPQQLALLNTLTYSSSSMPAVHAASEPQPPIGLEATSNDLGEAPKPRATAARPNEVGSRLDVFISDSRWMPYGTVNGIRFSQLSQGIMASVTYYKDRNFGFEVRGNTQIPSISETSTGGAVGIVYRFSTPFKPTIHANGGAQRFVGPNVPTINGTGYYGNPPTWASTASFGASGEWSVPRTNGLIAIRLDASYEYFHCSYGPITGPLNGGQVNVNGYNINPGLVFRLGHASGGGYRRSNY